MKLFYLNISAMIYDFHCLKTENEQLELLRHSRKGSFYLIMLNTKDSQDRRVQF